MSYRENEYRCTPGNGTPMKRAFISHWSILGLSLLIRAVHAVLYGEDISQFRALPAFPMPIWAKFYGLRGSQDVTIKSPSHCLHKRLRELKSSDLHSSGALWWESGFSWSLKHSFRLPVRAPWGPVGVHRPLTWSIITQTQSRGLVQSIRLTSFIWDGSLYNFCYKTPAPISTYAVGCPWSFLSQVLRFTPALTPRMVFIRGWSRRWMPFPENGDRFFIMCAWVMDLYGRNYGWHFFFPWD